MGLLPLTDLSNLRSRPASRAYKLGSLHDLCTADWRRLRHGIRGRLRLKCDGTRAETRFRLSAKRTSPFKSARASVQSTAGSRDVRISGSNVGYTTFRGSVKGTGYPLHSPVSTLTSPPVLHRVPSHFNWTLPTCLTTHDFNTASISTRQFFLSVSNHSFCKACICTQPSLSYNGFYTPDESCTLNLRGHPTDSQLLNQPVHCVLAGV
jgi:hypothetical protein